jgi:hypothetical protein
LALEIFMADEPENFVLQYLRRMDTKLDRVVDELVNVKQRLGSLEGQVALMRRDFSQLREVFLRLEHRIDEMDGRMLRIERRLNLVGA